MSTIDPSILQREYAVAFSNGNFEFVFPVMHESIVWEIFGQQQVAGRQAVMDYCKQVAQYFASVETRFQTHNIVESASTVAINGHATFVRDGKKVSELDAADFYEFDESGRLIRIRSYCINIEPAK